MRQVWMTRTENWALRWQNTKLESGRVLISSSTEIVRVMQLIHSPGDYSLFLSISWKTEQQVSRITSDDTSSAARIIYLAGGQYLFSDSSGSYSVSDPSRPCADFERGLRLSPSLLILFCRLCLFLGRSLAMILIDAVSRPLLILRDCLHAFR